MNFQLGELSEAEDALSEANILNNSDPEVWGYLALVCLQTGRQLEAEQAYKYAVKVGVSSSVIYEYPSAYYLLAWSSVLYNSHFFGSLDSSLKIALWNIYAAF